MTSFEPPAGGQRVWLGPTLIAIAVVSLVATLAAFFWVMAVKQREGARGVAQVVTPDAAALEGFTLPGSFSPVRAHPECASTPISRCYLTELPRGEAVSQWSTSIGMGEPRTVELPTGRAYVWCGTLNGAPAVAHIQPNVTNAKRVGQDSWRPPKSPAYDGRLVAGLALMDGTECP